jgi:hypothetical protein
MIRRARSPSASQSDQVCVPISSRTTRPSRSHRNGTLTQRRLREDPILDELVRFVPRKLADKAGILCEKGLQGGPFVVHARLVPWGGSAVGLPPGSHLSNAEVITLVSRLITPCLVAASTTGGSPLEPHESSGYDRRARRWIYTFAGPKFLASPLMALLISAPMSVCLRAVADQKSPPGARRPERRAESGANSHPRAVLHLLVYPASLMPAEPCLCVEGVGESNRVGPGDSQHDLGALWAPRLDHLLGSIGGAADSADLPDDSPQGLPQVRPGHSSSVPLSCSAFANI